MSDTRRSAGWWLGVGWLAILVIVGVSAITYSFCTSYAVRVLCGVLTAISLFSHVTVESVYAVFGLNRRRS